MNEPKAAEAGGIAIGGGAKNINWTVPTEEGQIVVGQPSSVVSGFSFVRQRFDVIASVDNTGVAPVAAAMNAAMVRLAAARPGATYRVLDGQYNCEVPLSIPYGISFIGPETSASAGPFEFGSASHMGAQLIINHTGKGIMPAVGGQQKIKNFEIFYPGQNAVDAPGYTPVVYDWTVYIGANCHWVELENIRCPNPYQYIYWAANGGKAHGIHGYALNRGVYLGRCADVIRFHDLHLNPTSWATVAGPNIRSYVQTNAKIITIDGAEQFDFTDCFAEDGRFGILCIDEDGDGSPWSYGTFKGGSLDTMGDCVYVDSGLNGIGLKLVGVALIPNGATGHGVLFADTAVPSATRNHPTVRSLGSTVHGTHDRSVWMQTGSHGVFTAATGGYFDALNDVLRKDSTTSVLSVDRIEMPTGATRTGGSDSASIVDTNPISL